MAFICLGGRSKERLRKLVALTQSLRHLHAADGAICLILFQRGSLEVTSDDALCRKHIDLLYQHGAAAKFFFVLIKAHRIFLRVSGDNMVRDHVLRKIKPECGDRA